MIRRLSIRLLERLYSKTLEKNELINKKIEEYKKRLIAINQIPDENLINKFYNTPGINIWLTEDCGGYKKGRKIDEKDILNIKQLGYENVWISDSEVKELIEETGKIPQLLELRNEMITRLSEIFVNIDEKDAGSNRKGSKIDLLDGSDLLGIKIDPLQREGAAKIASKVLGDTGSKIEPLKLLIEKIYSLGIKSFCLNDNRTLGNIHIKTEDKGEKQRLQISNYLIMHSVNVGIMFTLTLHNIQKDRIEFGSQSSVARYTAGQKFNREFRVTYSTDVVDSACLGSFIFDIGFNHLVLKKILDKEIKDLINEQGEAIHKGFTLVSEKEYDILKKHVNVGSHIIQNLGIDSTSIITNMIRTHHCYLNGEGYPKRKGQDFNIALNNEDGSKKILKVFRYDIAIHEITNLLSIIDTYDAMINRRPWRLPFSRYDAVEYLINNSSYHHNPITGEIDKKGLFSFSGHEKREKKFDKYLVKKFLETINPYNIGEILPLRDLETNKKLTEAVVIKYTNTPHRPIVRIILKDKPVEINLEEDKNHRYYLGEYIVTTRKTDKDVKGEQMK